jgi:hypothetical protein
MRSVPSLASELPPSSPFLNFVLIVDFLSLSHSHSNSNCCCWSTTPTFFLPLTYPPQCPVSFPSFLSSLSRWSVLLRLEAHVSPSTLAGTCWHSDSTGRTITLAHRTRGHQVRSSFYATEPHAERAQGLRRTSQPLVGRKSQSQS